MIFYAKSKIKNKRVGDRSAPLIVVIFIIYGLIIFRLFYFQVLRRDFYEALASRSQKLYQELLPERGNIFVTDKDDKLYPVATNLDLYLAYGIPKYIKNPEETSKKIAAILELPEEEVLMKLSQKNDFYEVLKHYVAKEKAEEIRNLKIEGIDFSPEIKRFYPEKNYFSHLTGFIGYVGDQKVGQYGLEESYEKILAGQKGNLKAKKSALGSLIFLSDYSVEKAKDGADLVLTIDRTVQFKACEELKNAVIGHGADKGTVIIMEPKTGKILALCNYPDFDPNDYREVENINLFVNSAISHSYEPGSIFKVITMASALQENKVSPQTTYNDEGFVQIGEHTIKNSDGEKSGVVNMIKVLENSLNTGAVFAARLVGQKDFKKYVEDFGFGKITGIELPAEAKGNINSLNEKNEIYLANASFGQGLSVTPLQMLNSVASIANDGKLMKPYLIDKIVYPSGEIVTAEPQLLKQVISPQIANTLGSMMVSVVENGHGKKAGVKGYYVAGKTGTAQVAKEEGGGYDPNETIGSFVGFAPSEAPKFAMLVKIDRPRDVIWAESSAAPLFGKLAEFMLNYYQIPPERK